MRLSKIRLTSLVVVTTVAGYILAPAPFNPATLALVSLGTGLTSCAANSINQFLEVPFDAQMARTKSRVLVLQGLRYTHSSNWANKFNTIKMTHKSDHCKIFFSPLHAVGFALGASAVGLGTLYFGVNGVTCALGAANLLLYTCVYTPMKRVSILNTWIGSIGGTKLFCLIIYCKNSLIICHPNFSICNISPFFILYPHLRRAVISEANLGVP